MVAGVSHELNTPLGNVKLATSALRERIDEITRRDGRNDLSRAQVRDFLRDGRELIDLANHSIERAIDLVTHFKQVAVDQTSERRRQFDLASVINGTIATLRPSFKKEPWVINVDVPDDIQMDSYPGPLEQIVINLVLNSIRHGFDGRDAGCITIQGACDVGARNFSGTVVLKFIDDGIGIPAHHLDRVFDPFFTTKLGKGGSGIGLNITHRIATTLLGGSIKVESRFGSGSTGSTFTLSMPLRAPSAI
jgi:signal transduction histidine kinase